MTQLDHYSTKFSKQTFPIILISDNITNASNLGSLFRTADAFGIEKLILCGQSISLGRKMTKTSRATEKTVSYEIHDKTINILKDLRLKSYKIICLEITDTSKPVYSLDFSKEKPIALVVGNENFGIAKEILEFSDSVVHIEMYGQNSSMNVVQATNIALYEITKQLK